MPISTGLPRQSLIFWRALLRVMIFREIFLLTASLGRPVEDPARAARTPPPLADSMSGLWFIWVLAAGFTATQKGLT